MHVSVLIPIAMLNATCMAMYAYCYADFYVYSYVSLLINLDAECYVHGSIDVYSSIPNLLLLC